MTNEIVICMMIFMFKIIEVSFATVRMVLITKGEKVKGAFVAFFEITIWLLVSAKVLTGLSEHPIRGVMYVLGFVVGNYLGSVIEEKVALGIVTATIITSTENKELIVARLKELEIGFTVMQAQGQKDENKFIVAYMARNRKKVLLKNLKEMDIKFFISINESRDVYGGYGLTRKIK